MNSKSKASILSSTNVALERKSKDVKDNEEDFLNPGPEGISLAGEIRLKLKEHLYASPQSPITHRRRKATKFEVDHYFNKCECGECTSCSLLVSCLDMNWLHCSYLYAKGLTTEAMQGYNKVKHYHDKVLKSNIVKDVFLNFNRNTGFKGKHKKYMSKEDLVFAIGISIDKAMIQCYAASNFELAQEAISEALSLLKSETENPEISQPHLLAHILYHKTLIAIKEANNMLSQENNAFQKFWHKLKHLEIDCLAENMSDLSLSKTPTKFSKSHAKQCLAPMKKNLVPSTVKKALLSLQSTDSTSSTEDEINRINPVIQVNSISSSASLSTSRNDNISVFNFDSEGDDDAFLNQGDNSTKSRSCKKSVRRVSVGKKVRSRLTLREKSSRVKCKQGQPVTSKSSSDCDKSSVELYKFFKSKASLSSPPSIQENERQPETYSSKKSAVKTKQAKAKKLPVKSSAVVQEVRNSATSFRPYSDAENLCDSRPSTRTRARHVKSKCKSKPEKSLIAQIKQGRNVHCISDSKIDSKNFSPGSKATIITSDESTLGMLCENFSVEKIRDCSSGLNPVNMCIKGKDRLTKFEKDNILDIKPVPNNNSSNPSGLDMALIVSELRSAVACVEHYPFYSIYPNMCKILAVLEMTSSKEEEEPNDEGKNCDKFLTSSYLLTESFAVTLRHRALMIMAKTCSSNSMSETASYDVGAPLTNKSAVLKYKELSFSSAIENVPYSKRMQEMIDKASESYTVVQVCTVQELCDDTTANVPSAPKLIICRYRKGASPCVVGLNNSSKFSFNLLEEFTSIMAENRLTMGNATPKLWWSARTKLDRRLCNFIESMENTWLGGWKCLFLGRPVDKRRSELIEIALCNLPLHPSKELIRVFLDGATYLTDKEISSLVSELWKTSPGDNKHSKIMAYIKNAVNCFCPVSEREPVVLVIDKDLQCLPWENMPILRNFQVTRLPSVRMLNYHLASCNQHNYTEFKEIDSSKAFYILNPANDLPSTQKTFENKFKMCEPWEGIIGRMPTPAEFINAVSNYELFIYLGHGSGRRFLDGESLDIRTCGSVSILMGCSSGSLRNLRPSLEAAGAPLNHWLCGSPCIVGNLWDVTDKDIDRFTEEFLERWLPNYSQTAESGITVCRAVILAREKCRLKYLIGGAPVVYGLPIRVKNGGMKF